MNRLVAQAASLQYRRLPVGGAWNKLRLRTLRASSRLATLATCETADWAVCATFKTRFMVPMHAEKSRKRPFHELSHGPHPRSRSRLDHLNSRTRTSRRRRIWFMVPMHAEKIRKGALNEPHEFRTCSHRKRRR